MYLSKINGDNSMIFIVMVMYVCWGSGFINSLIYSLKILY